MLLGSVGDLRRERRKTLRPGNEGVLECLAAVDRDPAAEILCQLALRAFDLLQRGLE